MGVELDGDVPRPRQRAPAAHAVAVRGDPGARAVVVDGDADDLEAQPAVAGIIRLGLAGEECGADNPAVEERRRVEPGVAAGDGVADEEGAVVVVEEEEAEVGVVELEVGGVGEEVEGEARRGGGEGVEGGDDGGRAWAGRVAFGWHRTTGVGWWKWPRRGVEEEERRRRDRRRQATAAQRLASVAIAQRWRAPSEAWGFPFSRLLLGFAEHRRERERERESMRRADSRSAGHTCAVRVTDILAPLAPGPQVGDKSRNRQTATQIYGIV